MGVNAFFIGFLIIFIFCHFINKKQGKDFYSLIKQLSFPFQMAFYGFTNLNPPDLVFIGFRAQNFADFNLNSVRKLHKIGSSPAINTANGISFVFFQTAWLLIQIKSFIDNSGGFLNSVCTFNIEFQGCSRAFVFRKVNVLQIHITVCSWLPRNRNSFNRNLFYQLFIVGFHGIQPINHIERDSMRCRIADGH